MVHAMQSGATWLVPQLACHLRAGRRHLTYAIFAEELTAAPIAECAEAYAQADAWFSGWQGGDVQPDEMLIITDLLCTVCAGQGSGKHSGVVQVPLYATVNKGAHAENAGSNHRQAAQGQGFTPFDCCCSIAQRAWP